MIATTSSEREGFRPVTLHITLESQAEIETLSAIGLANISVPEVVSANYPVSYKDVEFACEAIRLALVPFAEATRNARVRF